ncbi:tail-anchored protein insertion receptor WRB [Copidosoma floridanum]|uniref:tail-anchored protein insertion receptor WRB n=1 Tax=Copidosoma floridanum TaxID=29053 RepID=UPI0006C9986C|nr:tail-anchored protein insertion receptor WRB [Copidosoma floridanum]
MLILFLLATISCLIDPFAAFIIKFITGWCCKETDEDQEMKKQLISLRKDMSSLSMVDEFSKYAKIQRKCNKLQDVIKEKLSARSTSRMKLKMSLTYGIRILNGIFTTILVFSYRSEPVVIFPTGYLWPVESFLSWPTGIKGCISLPSWIILMRLSVQSLLKASEP